MLLMDKMMKHCFGYIILSRSADSSINTPPEVTFHPKLSPNTKIDDLNRMSPAESIGSNITDIETELDSKRILDNICVNGDDNLTVQTSLSAGPSPAFGQSSSSSSRNKRKRVLPQQRDTVIKANKSFSPTTAPNCGVSPDSGLGSGSYLQHIKKVSYSIPFAFLLIIIVIFLYLSDLLKGIITDFFLIHSCSWINVS